MKAVLMSIRPEWCEKIANGKKLLEIRKTRPKLETPFKVYIYCTLPSQSELFTHGGIREYAHELIRLQSGEIVYDYGMRLCCDPENRPYSKDNFLCQKVIGEFVCDRIITDATYGHNTVLNTLACLTPADAASYCVNPEMYGWHITELEIYDTPKELSGYLVENNKTFDCPGLVALKRPPQSWCYVEGLK